MAQRVAAVPQPYLSAPRQVVCFDRTYQVGNGSLRLSVNKIRNGYSDVLTMRVTDSVAEKGGPYGYAKFDLVVTKNNKGEISWFLTTNFGRNFISRGMRSMQVEPYVGEMLFYGDPDKLLGCFSLDKGKGMVSGSGGTFCQAQLLHRRGEAVHAVKVQIVSNGTSFAANIDEPTIATLDQLQFMRSNFLQMKSNAEDDDDDDNDNDNDVEEDEGESRMEHGHPRGAMGQIKNGGSASGIGNGSVWNVVNLYKIKK